MTHTSVAVADADLPQLFQAADLASRRGQASYLRRTRFRLVLLCAAGASGVVSWQGDASGADVPALVGIGLFVLALAVEAMLWRDRPDKAWYDGRAVAESAKTLAWKYAVGGDPFPVDMPAGDAQRVLVDRLDALARQFSDLDTDPVDAPAITPWMRDQRGGGYDERRRVYLESRIGDQRRWYATKARYNRRRARQWRTALVLLEFGGAAVSLVEAVYRTGVYLAPVLAAVAGAVVAWLETKQHDSLARAYSAAVRDLASAEQRLLTVTSEHGWASEVGDAEEAISREHTVWLASRSSA